MHLQGIGPTLSLDHHQRQPNFMKKILIVLGHPSVESLNYALAESYAAGARAAGKEVRLLKLGELNFDPILHLGYNGQQPLEPALLEAQEDILWADHLVWVYPSWWGNMPALLKGFIDRTFVPGFAFKYRPNSVWWDKYLTGRSARIIMTMDTPKIYNTLLYRNANINALKHATLHYCGIKPVYVSTFPTVRSSDETQRKQWIKEVYALGQKD